MSKKEKVSSGQSFTIGGNVGGDVTGGDKKSNDTVTTTSGKSSGGSMPWWAKGLSIIFPFLNK